MEGQQQDISASLIELVRRQRAERPERFKPHNYTRPPYGSREWYGDYARGWFGDTERAADEAAHIEAMAATEARSARAKASRYASATAPARWTNKPPRPTRQYVNPMATEAMRDPRLCMGARALLVLLRARCGKGNVTDATKYALAIQMGRSVRTIQRYVVDLVRFGYVKTAIRTNYKGMFTGLRVWLTERVAPFWTKHEELAVWLSQASETIGFQDRTKLSPKNQTLNLFDVLGRPIGLP